VTGEVTEPPAGVVRAPAVTRLEGVVIALTAARRRVRADQRLDQAVQQVTGDRFRRREVRLICERAGVGAGGDVDLPEKPQAERRGKGLGEGGSGVALDRLQDCAPCLAGIGRQARLEVTAMASEFSGSGLITEAAEISVPAVAYSAERVVRIS
jgi:hypothetical protein